MYVAVFAAACFIISSYVIGFLSREETGAPPPTFSRPDFDAPSLDREGTVALSERFHDREENSHEPRKLAEDEVKQKNLFYSKRLRIGNGIGLYSKRSTPVIIELKDQRELESLIHSGIFSVVAFYSPWCGHCQHLVKPYTQTAKELQMLRNVTLAAISCENSPKSCSKHHIRAYPTFIAFGTPEDTKGDTNNYEGLRVNSGVKGVKEFVITNAIPYRGPLDWEKYPSIKPQSIENVKQNESDIDEWLNRTLNNLKRDAQNTTMPSERLKDGLTSIEYLLTSELPAIIKSISVTRGHDGDPVESAYEFLALLLAFVPRKNDLSIQARRQSLEEIATLLKDNRNKGVNYTGEHGRIVAVLENIRASISIKWNICGKGHSSTPLLSSPAYLDSSAYPCGLWMIMHFISVATEMSPASFKEWCISRGHAKSLSACAVHTTTIFRDFINDLFRCRSCAHHFVASYNACMHHRPGCNRTTGKSHEDNIATQSLQLWLWLVHNSVTKRIHRELVDLSNIKKEMYRGGLDNVLWPLGADTPHFNPLKFLQRTYYDPSW